MKKYLIIAVALLVLVLPAVSIGSPAGSQQPYMKIDRWPGVEINLTNSSFNLTFSAMILHQGIFNYVAKFPLQQWAVAKINSTTVEYSAELNFMYYRSMENFSQTATNHSGRMNDSMVDDFGFHGVPSSDITAHSNITLQKVSTTITEANGTAYNSTGLKISIGMTSSDISGSGYVMLVQFLGARSGERQDFYHQFNGFDRNMMFRNPEGVEAQEHNISAYYIWNNSYQVNGEEHQMQNYTYTSGGLTLLEFRYNFTDGLKSLFQDPYFSVPAFNVFNSRFLDNGIRTAADFIIEHAELFSAGIATGMVLVGIPYGLHRRRQL